MFLFTIFNHISLEVRKVEQCTVHVDNSVPEGDKNILDLKFALWRNQLFFIIIILRATHFIFLLEQKCRNGLFPSL